jgi:hypothetical protein
VHEGLRPVLARLEGERAQIVARQAFIRRLRLVVPMVLLPAALAALAVVLLDDARAGLVERRAGAALLLSAVVLVLVGTAPINKDVLTWSPDAPPPDWRARIHRWERLDLPRTVATAIAFALLLSAFAARLKAGE